MSEIIMNKNFFSKKFIIFFSLFEKKTELKNLFFFGPPN